MSTVHTVLSTSVVCLAAALAQGCGTPVQPGCPQEERACSRPETPPVQPVLVTRVGAAGARILLDSQGATDLAGAVLEIPAGALAHETEIRIEHAADLARPGETASGPALRILPDELSLRTLARLSLPLYPGGAVQGDRRYAAVALGPLPRRLVSGFTEPTRFTIDLAGAGTYQVLSFAGEQNLLPGETELQPGLDILFVIDNSPSMATKQTQVIKAAAEFVQNLSSYCTNYHLGIVSSNTGTYEAGGTPWKFMDSKSCNSERGDDGKMQNTSCRDRMFTVNNNKTNCENAACTNMTITGSLLTGTDNYIRFYYGPKPADTTKKELYSNTTGGQVDTFKCMSYLGDEGCGIEKPFESVQWALAPMKNPYFLRDNKTSTLLIVFIGDEDDCSSGPGHRVDGNPDTDRLKECYEMSTSDPFCFDWNYRCYAASTKCDKEMTSIGARSTCAEDAGSAYLTKVSDFVASYTEGGNRKVIVAGIWSPKDTPVEIVQVANVGNSASAALGLQRFSNKTKDDSGSLPQHRLSKLANDSAITKYTIDGKSLEHDIGDKSAAGFTVFFQRIADLVINKKYCIH